MDASLQNGGLPYSQQIQDYHNSQQGLNVPPPQGFYPSQQENYYGQPPAGTSQQSFPVSYDEQRLPQSQSHFPGASSYGPPSNYPMNSPYPPQQPYAPAPVGENASYYGTAPVDQNGHPIGPNGPTGPQDEKGAGSTVVGGAAGGYAGHKLGGGFLGSVAGAMVGAIGMNAVTHEIKDNNGKDKKHKYYKKHGCASRCAARRARRRRRWGYGASSSSSDSD